MSSARRNSELARALRLIADSLEAPTVDLEPQPSQDGPQSLQGTPWNALLWQVPPETRLSAEQAAEALGVSLDSLYKRTSEKAEGPKLPHRRLGGRLVFVASELRAWVREYEVLG